MKSRMHLLCSLVAGAMVLPAAAHHSFAMFDANKTVTVEGTVKKFQWTNPHSWLYVSVPDAGGRSADWAVEMGPPTGLVRTGWTPRTLTPGMKVKVAVHPLKDGNPGGQFLAVTLPDGRQMGDPNPREQAPGGEAQAERH